MNKKVYLVLACLTCAFGIKGVNGQRQITGDEVASIGGLARGAAGRAQQNLPTHLTVNVTGINNTLNKEVEISTPGTVDVLRPGQNFTGTFPLTHKGTSGFPTLTFKVAGVNKEFKYTPTGSTPRVRFEIGIDENGEIEVRKYAS